ncbi:hypothetical protein AB0J83_29085 [Actinoplanes sp. NPDC049596]|uniref:hypothetical protein n=1 Tax=unclassified Actinoplanes TaxID=2626549 RepID=UPI003421B5F0
MRRSLRVAACVLLLVVAAVAGWRGVLGVSDQIVALHGRELTLGLALCAVAVGAVTGAVRVGRGPVRDLWALLVPIVGAVVVVGLIVLATAWLYHDHLLAGYVTAGLAMLLPAGLLGYFISGGGIELDADSLLVMAVTLIPFGGGAVSFAVVSQARGHGAVASLFGVLGVLVVGSTVTAAVIGSRRSWPRRAIGVSLPLQLAGLAPAAGSVLLAITPDYGGALGDLPLSLFGVIAQTAGVVVLAALVQGALLAWLAPGLPPVEVGPTSSYGEDASGWEEERRYLQTRILTVDRSNRDEAERLRDRLDRGDVRHRRGGAARSRPVRTAVAGTSPRARPLMTAAVVTAAVDVAERTGLVIDLVWPRIEMVLPSEVRRRMRRADRSVAGLRVAVAGVLATAITWVVPLAGQAGSLVGNLAPVFALLLVAALLLTSLRARVSELYRRRADAVEIYRFDLARSLHVPIPAEPGAFARSAGVLMGTEPAPELTVEPAGAIPAVTGRLSEETADDLRRRIVDDVTSGVASEFRRLHTRQDQIERLVRSPSLDRDQLDALAERVAEQAAEPVSERLGERMQQMQQHLYDHIGVVVEGSLEAAVNGPPLANFTGFMVIDLTREGEGRPSHRAGQMLTAPAGGLLELSLFLIRDEKARGAAPRLESGEQFFVAEPIQIEGGRVAGVVEFEAVADSPTLHAKPNRRNLTVGAAAAETMFAFAMPATPGRHEIWFQLYQGGRLIQAVAVTVEAEAHQVPVDE